MLANRLIIWPTLVISYRALASALAHVLSGGWSAFATFGLLFAIVLGAPILVGYASNLWIMNRLRGFAIFEAAICVLMPAFILLLALFVIKFGGHLNVFA